MRIHVIEPLSINGDKKQAMTDQFKTEGHDIVFYDDRITYPSVIIERSKGADVVVIANMPFPARCVNSLPQLKLLAVAFTGIDHVDLDACRARSVSLCNASGYSTINVAELAIGLMIDLLRNVTRLDPVTRQGGTKEGFIGNDLAGKTVGIIGMGAIGQRVARILKAFGCSIKAVKREKRPLESELSIEYTSMETLLKSSDIVSLHCPLNDSTRGLIGAEELALMKRSAFLINTARGPVVDERSLVEALKSGQIAGAGLDVFDDEPPLSKELPVLELDNVIVTPHIAFATKEAFVRRADIVADNILSWISGSPKNLII